MGRTPCCDKANVKKGPWGPEEDGKLKEYIEKHGTGGNWISLPQKAGLRRCGKSCRLRWLNYLRPNIKHGDFSNEEDNIIFHLFSTIGSRWSVIAAQLPGRTDNDIKNHWNTKLKKKLMGTIPSSQKNPHTSSTSSSSSETNLTNYPNPTCFFSIFEQNHLLNTSSSSYFSTISAPIHQESFNSPMIQNWVEDDKKFIFRDCYSVNGWNDKETPLEYGIEEIKQLISSSNYSDVFFDEN